MKEASVRVLVAWGLAVILAWAFIFTGWRTIFPSSDLEMRFINWGYTLEFAHWIGIAEVVAGVLVLVPRLASIAALGLAIIMGGAIYTHFTTSIGSPLFAFILLAVSIAVVILRWPESILNMRRE